MHGCPHRQLPPWVLGFGASLSPTAPSTAGSPPRHLQHPATHSFPMAQPPGTHGLSATCWGHPMRPGGTHGCWGLGIPPEQLLVPKARKDLSPQSRAWTRVSLVPPPPRDTPRPPLWPQFPCWGGPTGLRGLFGGTLCHGPPRGKAVTNPQLGPWEIWAPSPLPKLTPRAPRSQTQAGSGTFWLFYSKKSAKNVKKETKAGAGAVSRAAWLVGGSWGCHGDTGSPRGATRT